MDSIVEIVGKKTKLTFLLYLFREVNDPSWLHPEKFENIIRKQLHDYNVITESLNCVGRLRDFTQAGKIDFIAFKIDRANSSALSDEDIGNLILLPDGSVFYGVPPLENNLRERIYYCKRDDTKS